MLDLVIKNAAIYNAFDTGTADIEIKDGKIITLAKKSRAAAMRTIAAANLITVPAAIDAHTHMSLNLGGFVSSDTFDSGTYAAVRGGTTTIIDFAYQRQGEDLITAVDERLKEIKNAHCDIKLHIGVTHLYPNIKNDVEKLIKRGFNTFKIHLNAPNIDDSFLYDFYSILSQFDNTIAIVHCEEGKIIEEKIKSFISEGKKDVIYHPLSRPAFVEDFAVRKILNYANQFKQRTYIAHLSTKRAQDFLKKNKSRYVLVETCPQYLYLTDKMYKRKDGYLYTCSPPFRKSTDNTALINGLLDDTIDTLSTDHCPFRKKDKDKWNNDFTKLPYGIPGVQTLYILALKLTEISQMTINKVVEKLAFNPAHIFGLFPQKGVIAPGANAEIAIFERKPYSITAENLDMNCDFSPYSDITAPFTLRYTINRGDTYEI